MNRHLLLEGIVALLILLFLYTALSKVLDFQAFDGQLLLQPFPVWSRPYLLWGLPAIELLACWLLLRRGTRLLGLYLSTFLLVVFTGYVALVLWRAFGYIPCSCGGELERMDWETHLAFNLFFLALSIIATVLQHKAPGRRSGGDGSRLPAEQKGGKWQEKEV